MKLIKEPVKSNKRIVKGWYIVAVLAVSSFILMFYINVKKDIFLPTLSPSDTLSPPVASHRSGFYTAPFLLTFKLQDKETRIYYTTDGSTPSLSSFLYRTPIRIENRTLEISEITRIRTSPRYLSPVGEVFKGMVIRAIAVKAGKASNEIKHSFFIDPRGRQRYNLPVVSLITDKSNLFDYNKGIYGMGKAYDDKDNYAKKKTSLNAPWWDYPANYKKRGKDWERPVFIDFFETGQDSGFSTDAGMRIHGTATRAFSQKSLRITFNGEYGIDTLNYELIPGDSLNLYKKIVLRNSGNDWNRTRFRDLVSHKLFKNTNVDIQDGRPGVVFINGEYWGFHNIRQYHDEFYLSQKYQLITDRIVIREQNGTVVFGTDSGDNSFKNLISFIQQNDLSDPKNYEIVERRINMDNFIDYVTANCFFNNTDWPGNNVKAWRYKTLTDSVQQKWHWFLGDMDYGMGYTGLEEAFKNNMIQRLMGNRTEIGIVFSALSQNEEFKERFATRFEELLSSNLAKENVIAQINTLHDFLAPGMSDHINRWHAPISITYWESNVNQLRTFAINRPKYIRQHLKEYINSNNN